MTSPSSLTSRRIFVSRQHWTESDFRIPSMTKVFMKSCLFIVCKTMFTIGESQAISLANRTANTRAPILGDPGAVSRAGRKCATKVFKHGRKSPQLSPDHFQTVKRMLAPDWAQKMLCIIVPNRRTAPRHYKHQEYDF